MAFILRNRCGLVGAALVMSCPMAAYPAQSAAGQYEREEGNGGGGSVKLEDLSGGARLTVQIGGIPDGAATHPDCGFIAEGKISNGLFSGAVTRQGGLEGLSPEGDRAEAGLPILTATVNQDSITFESAAATRYCGGDGYTLDGVFVSKK